METSSGTDDANMDVDAAPIAKKANGGTAHTHAHGDGEGDVDMGERESEEADSHDVPDMINTLKDICSHLGEPAAKEGATKALSDLLSYVFKSPTHLANMFTHDGAPKGTCVRL